jgi:hypothetical protein
MPSKDPQAVLIFYGAGLEIKAPRRERRQLHEATHAVEFIQGNYPRYKKHRA